MMTEKKQLTQEEKTRILEEQAFNKRWGKKIKLYGDIKNTSKNVGKAPTCNTNHAKKEVAVTTASKKKK